MNKKGISLVALVITIIVLIILSLAAILLAREGGIFSRARQAVDENNRVQKREIVQVALANARLKYSGAELTLEMANYMQQELSKADPNVVVTFYDGEVPSILVTYKEETFEVGENFTVDFEKTYEPETVSAIAGQESLWIIAEEINSDGKYTIIGYNGSTPEQLNNVTVPNTVVKNGTTYNISRVGDGMAPLLNSNNEPVALTGTLTISNGLIVEQGAFNGYYELTKVETKHNVTLADGGSFRGCNLDSIVIGPYAIIGDSAFSGYSDSECRSITIHRTLREVKSNAFASASPIIYLGLGSGTIVGDQAFYGCTNLKDFVIPSNVTIGMNAFMQCTGLRNIKIGNNVQLGDYAFAFCGNTSDTRKATISIGNNVTMGTQAFANFSNITSISIGSGANIGYMAFSYSYTDTQTLGKLTIGDGATIGQDAFMFCNDLGQITLGNNITMTGMTFAFTYQMSEGDTYLRTGNNITMDNAFQNSEGIKTLVMGNDIIINGDQAFSGRLYYDIEPRLETVKIGNNSTISVCCFQNCTSLNRVELGDYVTIGSQAFLQDENIQTVIIGNNATLEQGSFMGCTGITTAEIGDSATLGEESFIGCSSLAIVTMGNDANLGDDSFFNCSGLNTFTIGTNYQLGDNVFGGCPNAIKTQFGVQ